MPRIKSPVETKNKQSSLSEIEYVQAPPRSPYFEFSNMMKEKLHGYCPGIGYNEMYSLISQIWMQIDSKTKERAVANHKQTKILYQKLTGLKETDYKIVANNKKSMMEQQDIDMFKLHEMSSEFEDQHVHLEDLSKK